MKIIKTYILTHEELFKLLGIDQSKIICIEDIECDDEGININLEMTE